jgi:hypothetical protein
MRVTLLTVSSLILLLITIGCRQQEALPGLYTEADSILNLTMDIQARISSPEIQRMNDFQLEINTDLEFLEDIESDDTILVRYRDLAEGLGQCMQTCSHYHEEAFMLEASLRVILEQIRLKDPDLEDLQAKFNYEIENYQDLRKRIDSSLIIIGQQAEIFYSLKPEIDKIKTEIREP